MPCFLCGFKTTDAKPPICKNGPCEICSALTEVDEEINQAVASLECLLSKRYEILSRHNCVRGLIQRLPIELKNRIFELLMPESESQDEWGIDGTGVHSFLSTISVCKGWRDVALSNPFLWSKIHIDLRTSYETFSRINDWTLRSRNLPLTLHIQVNNDTIDPERVLDALSRCSNRLKSLSLNIMFSDGSNDVPLGGLQHNKLQYHRLTQLQVVNSRLPRFDQPLSLLNSTASPEKVVLVDVSFRSLQISWNRLVSATVTYFDLGDLSQLFQHASQMTFCQIFNLISSPHNFSMPPIIHHRLKTLSFPLSDWGLAPDLLSPLTLPCLQEIEISKGTHLINQLPALVRRSSCPLTRLTLYQYHELPFGDLEPLPGVTDLVVKFWISGGETMMRLLLGGYFPDLCHLTLQLQPFRVLWDDGFIPLLLDLKRPQPDGGNEGRFNKFIVVDRDLSEIGHMWDSDVGERLKEMNVMLRDDGFEFF